MLWSRWRRLAERAPRDRPPIDRSFLACTAERRLHALFSPVTFAVSSLAESDFLHHGRQEEPHKVKAVASDTEWGLSGGRSTKKRKRELGQWMELLCCTVHGGWLLLHHGSTTCVNWKLSVTPWTGNTIKIHVFSLYRLLTVVYSELETLRSHCVCVFVVLSVCSWRPKRMSKPSSEDGYWDCSVCTFKNSAEAFKCLMCDVRKGTSTR